MNDKWPTDADVQDRIAYGAALGKIAKLQELIREAVGCTDREWYSTIRKKLKVAVDGFGGQPDQHAAGSPASGDEKHG